MYTRKCCDITTRRKKYLISMIIWKTQDLHQLRDNVFFCIPRAPNRYKFHFDLTTRPHEVNDLELCIAIFVGFYQSLISFLLINCNQVCLFFKFWWHSRKVLTTIFIIFLKKQIFVLFFSFDTSSSRSRFIDNNFL